MAESLTQDQYVEQELKAKNLKNTPANRKKLKEQYSVKYRGGASDDWKTIFKNEFPQFASMFDSAEGETQARGTFGDDLIDLFYDAARNPDNYDFVSQAGRSAWVNKVQATKFYQNTLPNQRLWDLTPKIQQDEQVAIEAQRLQASYGTLQLSDTEAKQIAVYKLRNKANELQEKYFTFSLIGARANQAEVGLSTTDQAAAIKRGLKAYGYAPKDLDSMINASLTGQKYNGIAYTTELLEQKAKNSAKVMHPHLNELIDKEFTLDDIFEPYRELISKTLEMNPNSVNRDDKMFNDVLDLVDQKGQAISGTDFLYRLKTDPKYRYGFTQQAEKEVNTVFMGLEKAFGKVR